MHCIATATSSSINSTQHTVYTGAHLQAVHMLSDYITTSNDCHQLVRKYMTHTHAHTHSSHAEKDIPVPKQ